MSSNQGSSPSTGTAQAIEPEAESGPILLDQGWSPEIRERFYFTAQGSRMMPYRWFKALERADGEGLFADPEYLASFGLLLLVLVIAFGASGCYGLHASKGGGQVRFSEVRQIDPGDVAVPEGYRVDVVAQGLTYPTGVAIASDGTLYVTEAGYSYGAEPDRAVRAGSPVHPDRIPAAGAGGGGQSLSAAPAGAAPS